MHTSSGGKGPSATPNNNNNNSNNNNSNNTNNGEPARGVKISSPFGVQHRLHVTRDFAWSGIHGEDPSRVFKLTDQLGEGSFGSVHKAVHIDSGHVLAVKVVPAADDALTAGLQEDLKKEIDVLKRCTSKYIVSYFGSAIHKHKDGNVDLWIIMDYMSKGSVRDLIEETDRTLSERNVAFVMKATLLGLEHLHGMRIAHRDIKAANILVSEQGEIKLADFGVSAQLTESLRGSMSMTGSPLWMAPEVILRRIDPALVFRSDIWSLGITAIECAEGVPPCADMKPSRAMVGIPSRPPPTLTEPTKWSKPFNDFIAACLVKDPKQRPTVGELLMHPFITAVKDTDNLEEFVRAGNQTKKKWGNFLGRSKATQATGVKSSSGTTTAIPGTFVVHGSDDEGEEYQFADTVAFKSAGNKGSIGSSDESGEGTIDGGGTFVDHGTDKKPQGSQPFLSSFFKSKQPTPSGQAPAVATPPQQSKIASILRRRPSATSEPQQQQQPLVQQKQAQTQKPQQEPQQQQVIAPVRKVWTKQLAIMFLLNLILGLVIASAVYARECPPCRWSSSSTPNVWDCLNTAAQDFMLKFQ